MMIFLNVISALLIVQFPIICFCHGGMQDVILSPNEFGGKYVRFNRLIEMTTKVPWEEPLRESAKIALSNLKLSKDSLQKAPYIGFVKLNPPSFGDIVVLAKGKLKRLPNETFIFEEIAEVCEFECQNNADRYLENVTALWMVERIRHRDDMRGYRFDLRFTIVPISSENSRNSVNGKSNNLEERLRNQLKKTFILRDTDYPKYFQNVIPNYQKLSRRVDSLDRSISTIMNPNNLMHAVFGYPHHSPKLYHLNDNRLNMGEYLRKGYTMPKPPPLNSYYIPNLNHRYPIRFPDSREAPKTLKNPYIRNNVPIKDEEKQEAHIIANIVDHRGAVELNKPQQVQHKHTNTHPGRSTSLFVPQQTITLPLLVPQMPMSILQVSPYTIPVQLQLSTPPNQLLYQQPQHQDVTTFRYHVPPFQYIPQQNKSIFKESERINPTGTFSFPDPVYHKTTTSETPIYPTMYTPKLSNYVTASSVQVNSYDNSDFQPIDPPPYLVSRNRKPTAHSEVRNQTRTIEKPTTQSTPFSNFKHYERNRHASERKEKPTKPTIITTTPTTTTTTTEFPRNHQENFANYDIVATRPTSTRRTTTEKPILKWLPKKHRNKTALNILMTTQSTTALPIIETTISHSNFYPTSKASTHSQIFRGRNRFYNKRNYTTSSVTEKSTTLSSITNQTPLKLLKRKATSLLPITTQQPPSLTTTSVFPTFVTSYTESNEPITHQSYSTSISLQIDGVDTTQSSSSYELVPAGVEVISSNSSNVEIYKASDTDEVDDDKVKIEEIATSLIRHAHSTSKDNDVKKSPK